MFVIVDWRPYDLPEVYGPFESEDAAEAWAAENVASIETDGVDVRRLNSAL